MGAPIANGNGVRHGLTTGSLPKGAGYVKRITNELRTAIETAVSDAKGEVCLHDAAAIQTAVRWERHALLCQRWLRNETDKLTPDQRLAFSRDIARASAERDKCLKILNLDVRANSDPWLLLDRERAASVSRNGSHVPPSGTGSAADDSPVDHPADAAGDESGDMAADSDQGEPGDAVAVQIIIDAGGPTR